MRRLALAAVLMLAACGSSAKHVAVQADRSTSSTPSTSSTTVPPPDTVPDLGTHPHFDTPEAAMKYLATAWNSHDLTAERHVTNPAARDQLDEMRNEAVNLRFDRCERHKDSDLDLGDYVCYFKHDYPPNTSTTMAGGIGEATVLVGPADTPGWYMTIFQGCG
ncbi:MAG TPA: hypothetical protein VKJ07_02045 [Mycobacteriales bacterium]|nr:hypothetical protein [Mycobacteriales bacterium]